MAAKENSYDVVVIGGGPGGYPAAIKAAQNGATVALVEAESMGGTCLNVGCIPTKTLIANAEALKRIQQAEELGIVVGKVSFDFGKMTARKDQVVTDVRKGLEKLIASNDITLFRGFGELTSPTRVKVKGKDNAILDAKNIILATGSHPRDMAAFPFDHKKILNSDDILTLKKLPKKLVIIGGGIIGCEFASLYNAFSVEVTILEMMPDIIPLEASNVRSHLRKAFEKKGITVRTSCAVSGVEVTKSGVKVSVSDSKPITGDLVLVAVGRGLNTTGIGLEKAGVSLRDNGSVPVNEKMETNVAGIYAIGDITGKWQLAHVASHQGIIAANNSCGHSAQMRYNAVPSVIFTDPEIGSVGMTLEQAIEEGHPATIGAFPFAALGKSQATLQTEGFAQLVIHKRSGQILGAQVVGHEAAVLVAEMGVAIANELTVESITETIHAHPTIAEVWLEAAMVAAETPLHLPPKKRKTAAAK